MSNDYFNKLLMDTGLSIVKASEKLAVSKSTIINYKSGKTLPPQKTIIYLRLLTGDLSVIDENYSGWVLKRGEIISPNNETFSLERLRYVALIFEEIRALREKLKSYDKKIKKLDLSVRPANDPHKINIFFLKQEREKRAKLKQVYTIK